MASRTWKNFLPSRKNGIFKYVSTILSILLVFALPVIAKDKKGELKKLLREAIANKKAQVGIAVIINGEDTITLNNKVRYP